MQCLKEVDGILLSSGPDVRRLCLEEIYQIYAKVLGSSGHPAEDAADLFVGAASPDASVTSAPPRSMAASPMAPAGPPLPPPASCSWPCGAPWWCEKTATRVERGVALAGQQTTEEEDAATAVQEQI